MLGSAGPGDPGKDPAAAPQLTLSFESLKRDTLFASLQLASGDHAAANEREALAAVIAATVWFVWSHLLQLYGLWDLNVQLTVMIKERVPSCNKQLLQMPQ